ncbi:MAG: sensor histidine kinase [Bryobacterales bacterium]|nr:sensor histidine kinase [Bryobacterales bacterium]
MRRLLRRPFLIARRPASAHRSSRVSCRVSKPIDSGTQSSILSARLAVALLTFVSFRLHRFPCDNLSGYRSRGAEEFHGWTAEEAAGKFSHQLTRTVFPAPLDEINPELLRTGRWEGEFVTGLAICHSIIDAHHGRIWFASSEGPGATACFRIPIQSGGAQSYFKAGRSPRVSRIAPR